MRSGVGVVAHPSLHMSITIAGCTCHPPYEQLLVGVGMGAVVVLSLVRHCHCRHCRRLHTLMIHPTSRGSQAWGGCVGSFVGGGVITSRL
ncbi:hypothetical protein L208DRAFT_1408640 [Tricholoma matsutake]|nr:hypothetical protein L208DRAFT_1408640 [Tricholoma matsutake 945]